MLRLSRNSMNVNMSTERIPAIHVSGHDKTTEAGVEGHLYEYNAYHCMFDTTASPSSRLGATRRPRFFFRFFIGEFIQLFHSNEAPVDLRSMATYVGVPLVRFSATCPYTHTNKNSFMEYG